MEGHQCFHSDAEIIEIRLLINSTEIETNVNSHIFGGSVNHYCKMGVELR